MKWLWILLLALALSGCTDGGDEPGGSGDDPDGPGAGNGDGSGEGDGSEGSEGNETEDQTEPEVVTVQIAAVRPLPTDTHAFDVERIEVNQGDYVTITLSNDDSIPIITHDWYLEELDVGTDAISPGEVTSLTFIADLDPGEYAYYCTIGSHREDGMEGVLVVL